MAQNLSPSFTSYVVARGTVAASRKNKGLLSEKAIALSGQLASETEKLENFKKFKIIPQTFLPAIIDLMGIKGLSLHYLLRKKFIEEKVRSEIANGVRQLVIIGSGLDTLGLRLAEEYADLTVVEIDQPGAQTIKTKISSAGKVIFDSSNLEEKTLPQILAAHKKYNAKKPTIFVAEGVLMYLQPKTAMQIFEHIAKAAKDSSFVFTSVDKLESRNSDLRAKMLNKILKKTSEAFSFELSKSELEKFANKNKLKIISLTAYHELQIPYRGGRYIESLSHQRSEYICFIKGKSTSA